MRVRSRRLLTQHAYDTAGNMRNVGTLRSQLSLRYVISPTIPVHAVRMSRGGPSGYHGYHLSFHTFYHMPISCLYMSPYPTGCQRKGETAVSIDGLARWIRCSKESLLQIIFLTAPLPDIPYPERVDQGLNLMTDHECEHGNCF